MKKFIASISVFVVAFTGLIALAPVQTAHAAACEGESPIFPRWYDGLCMDNDNKKIKSPSQGNETTAEQTATSFSVWIGVIAMNIVKMLMVVVGYVSLGFIIWGGFKYMLSGDSSSGTVAARKTIQNAVIGLVLSITSISLISFVVGAIG